MNDVVRSFKNLEKMDPSYYLFSAFLFSYSEEGLEFWTRKNREWQDIVYKLKQL